MRSIIMCLLCSFLSAAWAQGVILNILVKLIYDLISTEFFVFVKQKSKDFYFIFFSEKYSSQIIWSFWNSILLGPLVLSIFLLLLRSIVVKFVKLPPPSSFSRSIEWLSLFVHFTSCCLTLTLTHVSITLTRQKSTRKTVWLELEWHLRMMKKEAIYGTRWNFFRDAVKEDEELTHMAQHWFSIFHAQF